MGTLVHADIFFFVTTIAVVVVALALTAVLIYLVVILRRVRDVMDEVKAEAVLIRDDIHDFRDQMRSGGFKLAQMLSFGASLFGFGKKKRSRKE